MRMTLQHARLVDASKLIYKVQAPRKPPFFVGCGCRTRRISRMVDHTSQSALDSSPFRTYFGLLIVLTLLDESLAAMTHKQLEQSMDMMRGACSPKFPSLTPEDYSNLRAGNMDNDSKDMRCYTTCIAQMTGTITKKKEINFEKALAQLDTMLPPELKEPAKAAVNACRSVQSNHKDVCDRTWFSVKCMRDFNPAQFSYP